MRKLPAILAASVVALAGLGLAGAALTQTNVLAPLFSTTETAAAQKGDALETFSGEVDPAIKTGTIDFRSFAGVIQVVGWDEPRYEIQVFVPKGGQTVGDVKVEPQFTADGTDALNLKLVVEETGAGGVTLYTDGSPEGEVLVTAFVPKLTWTTVFLCTGTSYSIVPNLGIEKAIYDALSEGEPEEDDAAGLDATCIEREGTAHPSIAFNLNPGLELDEAEEDNASASQNPTFLVKGLAGGELAILANYADIAIEDATFEGAAVLSHYGDLALSLSATRLIAATNYGDATIAAAADELAAFSDYGDLKIALLDGKTGSIHAMSHYGDVAIQVPYAPNRGYDASARTEYGEVLIALRDTGAPEAEEDEGVTTAAPTALGLPGLAPREGRDDPEKPEEPKRGGEDYEGGDFASARSKGFETKAIQVTIEAASNYGDIVITDGKLPAKKDK